MPSALTDGGFPTNIPVSGIKFTDVAPDRSLPFIVKVRLVPNAPVIGMIEAISGGGRVTVKISAKGVDGFARPLMVLTVIVLAPRGAVEERDMSTVTEFPSGDTIGAPFMVIPVLGWKETCDVPSRLAPFMDTIRLLDPMAPLFGVMDLIVGPKAIPTGAA